MVQCLQWVILTSLSSVQMGKVIGGGLPVGTYGGRQEIMQMVAPAGETRLHHSLQFGMSVNCLGADLRECTRVLDNSHNSRS